MGDDKKAGLALRWAFFDLLNRVETGDSELIEYTLRNSLESMNVLLPFGKIYSLGDSGIGDIRTSFAYFAGSYQQITSRNRTGSQ